MKKANVFFCVLTLLLWAGPAFSQTATPQHQVAQERKLEDACFTLLQTVESQMAVYGFQQPQINAYWRMMAAACHKPFQREGAIAKLNTDLLSCQGTDKDYNPIPTSISRAKACDSACNPTRRRERTISARSAKADSLSFPPPVI